jgi:hypothetical protein
LRKGNLEREKRPGRECREGQAIKGREGSTKKAGKEMQKREGGKGQVGTEIGSDKLESRESEGG